MDTHTDRLNINRDWKLPDKISPSDWSAKNVMIAEGNAQPGRISYTSLAYQPEIIDSAEDRAVTFLSIMSAAQVGKTQIGISLILFFVKHSPRSIIVLHASETESRNFLSGKLDPALRSNPNLARCFVSRRSTDGVFNNQFRDFRGGALMCSWGGSLKTLRQRSAPFIFIDESEQMEYTSEGHVGDIIAERSSTFPNRLVMECSTPGDKGVSRIDSRYQLGDMRRWFMRCIECKETQVPDWEDVQWQESNPVESARWVCRSCGYLHRDYERIEASRNGIWIAQAPFINHASFHVSGIASPLRRLGDMTSTYQSLLDSGKPFVTFTNTVLGLPFASDSNSAEDIDLQSRAEDYDAPVPESVRGLTCAVDVQASRLEVGVYGWDRQSRSWVIGYSILYGNPGDSEVWKELEGLLTKGWARSDGTKQHILACGIDSRYETMQVENFIANFRTKASRIGCRLYAIRGTNSQRNPSVIQRSSSKYKVGRLSVGELVNINAHASKVHAMRLLNVKDADSPGFCRFPLSLDSEFYDSLTAEEMQTGVDRRGYAKVVWTKLRDRNEAFDIFRYNHAMAMLSGVFNDEGADVLNVAGESTKRKSRHFW